MEERVHDDRPGFDDLVDLMARLRAPDGCPWDREQSLESLKAYLIEEAYEVLEVMDHEHAPKHKEELGDLLFQIVFQAQIAAERGDFDVRDVVAGIVEKMVRRHPHVFEEGERAASAEDAYNRWERIKQEERRAKAPQRASVLQGVPRHLPALLKALRITDKAARVGFDWQGPDGVMDKLAEELGELKEALAGGDAAAIDHELGDTLFTLVNLSRFLEINPEESLRRATDRFSRRFMAMEARLTEEGQRVEDTEMARLDALWEAVKAAERAGGSGPSSAEER